MTRYQSSFFLTLFIYIVLSGIFFVILANNVIIKKDEKKNKVISLQHIKLIKKKIIEEVKQSPIIKEPKKTTVLKQKVKKEIIKKKVIIKPIKVKQKIIEEQPINKFKKKQIIKQTITYKEDFLKKNLYLIQKAIQKSIIYPKRAKRMGVQGRIILEFTFLSNGKLKDINIISGHRLLRKATIRALKNALPFFPTVLETITIKAPINYRFK